VVAPLGLREGCTSRGRRLFWKLRCPSACELLSMPCPCHRAHQAAKIRLGNTLKRSAANHVDYGESSERQGSFTSSFSLPNWFVLTLGTYSRQHNLTISKYCDYIFGLKGRQKDCGIPGILIAFSRTGCWSLTFNNIWS